MKREKRISQNRVNDDDVVAKELLEVIPRTMSIIRAELRSVAKLELTIPQFRILAHLSRGPLNNGQLAEIQGVSVAAMSRMVDSLVRRNLIKRASSKSDRRQIQLVLTTNGRRMFGRYKASAQKNLSIRFSKLETKPKQTLREGLSILGDMFP